MTDTPRHDWGPWVLDAANYTLERGDGGWFGYWIDLEACTSPGMVLDRIAQVAGKAWADDATLAGLVRALTDVLNPQHFLCSSGAEKHTTKEHVRRQVQRADDRGWAKP